MFGHSSRSTILRLFITGVAAITCMACDKGEECTSVQAECNPLYQPVFDEVFARTIKPGCAISGNSCHSGANAKAGLRMDEAEETYRLLVTEGRLVPGDPECSLMTVRLNGGGGGVMPPGAMLPDGERCAIEKWIADGAKR